MNDHELLSRYAPQSDNQDITDLRDAASDADDETLEIILSVNTGQLTRQAICRAELDRRQRGRQQMAFERQYRAARFSARAAAWSALATMLIATISYIQLYMLLSGR